MCILELLSWPLCGGQRLICETQVCPSTFLGTTQVVRLDRVPLPTEPSHSSHVNLYLLREEKKDKAHLQ